VKIHEDNWRERPQALHLGQPGMKRVLQRRHEGTALEIQDANERTIRAFDNCAAAPGRSWRIIEWPNKPSLGGKQFHDFFLIPKMIATRNNIDTSVKNFLSCFWRDARTSCRVLSIRDHQVNPVSLAQLRDKCADGSTTWLTDNISDEQQLHRIKLCWEPRPASCFATGPTTPR
jgi:hypothetical protein